LNELNKALVNIRNNDDKLIKNCYDDNIHKEIKDKNEIIDKQTLEILNFKESIDGILKLHEAEILKKDSIINSYKNNPDIF
jgi:hypothetical protein